ncbi:hypothetical protein D3C72_2587720 [compost metagenome]
MGGYRRQIVEHQDALRQALGLGALALAAEHQHRLAADRPGGGNVAGAVADEPQAGQLDAVMRGDLLQ